MKGFNNKFLRRTTTKVEEDFIQISEKEASILAEKLEELNSLRIIIECVEENGVFYKIYTHHGFKDCQSLVKRAVLSVLKDREKELKSFFYKTK